MRVSLHGAKNLSQNDRMLTEDMQYFILARITFNAPISHLLYYYDIVLYKIYLKKL